MRSAVNTIGIGIKLFVMRFEVNIECGKDEDGEACSQSQQVEEGVDFIFIKIPDNDFQVVAH